MEILLINPLQTNLVLPQGLLYLASAIKNKGHKVIIHDENVLIKNKQSKSEHFKSLQKILSYKIKTVGLSVFSNYHNIERAEFISRVLKNEKDYKIIWGGWHPTLFTDDVLKNNDVDIIVKGPGEEIICELLNDLEENKSLHEKYSDKIVSNKILLESNGSISKESYFPKLDFKLLDLTSYLESNSNVLPYSLSRGCCFKCRYCAVTYFYNSSIFYKPKNDSARELKELCQQYNIDTINIPDDYAVQNNKKVDELYEIIEQLGTKVNVFCSTRVNSINNFSKGSFDKLRKIGLYGFSVGIESGSENILKKMNKQNTKETIISAIDKLIENKIFHNTFNFIFRYPGEERQDVYDSLALIGHIRKKLPFSVFALHIARPTNNYMYDNLDIESEQGETFAQKLKSHYKSSYPYFAANRSFDSICFYISASMPQSGMMLKIQSRFIGKILSKLAFWRVVNMKYSFPVEYKIYTFFIRNKEHYMPDAHLMNN